MAIEALLDTGAVTSAIAEEVLIRILNHFLASGITPDHEEWPLIELAHWGGGKPGEPTDYACGVAKSARLWILGRATLETWFIGMNGQKVSAQIGFRVFAADDSD